MARMGTIELPFIISGGTSNVMGLPSRYTVMAAAASCQGASRS